MSNSRFLYRFGRLILGPIFKWYYNPKIIGRENIKNDGSLIIASNHIHLFDQCSTIISTKRIITYMAKKEYFDSKKTAWFFRGVGCIPVDRSRKDIDATSSAISVLKDGGVIGIFPEGTRNNLKEDVVNKYYNEYFKDYSFKKFKKKIKKIKYSEIMLIEKLLIDKKITEDELINNFFNIHDYLKNLYLKKVIAKSTYLESFFLPLKYGTVSMAYKTGAYILPTIVMGDYKFRSNNLIIKYGKPFKVDNDDLEYFNKKLLKEYIKLLDI